MTLTDEHREQIVSLYENGNSIYQIADLIGCAPQTVHKRLVKAGVICRDRSLATRAGRARTRTAEEEAHYQAVQDKKYSVQLAKETLQVERAESVQQYQSGQSATSIGKATGRPTITITRWLKNADSPMRTLSQACRQHDLNEEVFASIETEAQAYWLGFLTADGGISDLGTVRVNLQERDKDQLEKLQSFFETTIPVTRFEIIKPTYARTGYYLSVHSQRLCADLARLGLGPRKSKTVRWCPNVPEELSHHYVRGVFDGDGTWSSMNKKGTAGWHLIGNREFLLDVQEKMIPPCRLRKTKLIDHHTTPEIALLSWTGSRQVMRIVEWMYQDATILMPRKFDKCYAYLKQHYPDDIDDYRHAEATQASL